MLRALPGFMALALLALAGCGVDATLPIKTQTGASPSLPPPNPKTIPAVNIAPAEGCGAGAKPIAAPGFEVGAFARGLDHPRWLYVLPNGDALVAESNAPAEAQGLGGLKGWVMKRVMKRAGAGVPSPDRIVLLRDSNGDGIADIRGVFLDHLHSPFGMALLDGSLYVADTDALLRFPYRGSETSITARAEKVTGLPAGPINYHWTKNVVAGPDGDVLYVAIGSNSNVGDRGMAVEEGRARIDQVDPATGDTRMFAFGMRNPVGMAVQPGTGALWAVVNERDELGGDLVPDYLTRVTPGGFYGWPYSYFGQHVDPRVKPQRPDLVARAIVPDYALGSHVAALGLAFYTGDLFSRRVIAAVPSSVSTGRGTAGRKAATRLSSWRSPVTNQPVHRKTSSPDSLLRTARRRDARSASRSLATVRCWSPTTSAMWSGASRRHRKQLAYIEAIRARLIRWISG
jgi:glucose/arabinose dehydrogenase